MPETKIYEKSHTNRQPKVATNGVKDLTSRLEKAGNANGGHLRGEMLQCYKNVTKKRSLSAGAQVKVGQR